VERDAFDKSLRELARRVPFEPFLVEFTSGSQIEVQRPEALAFSAGVAVHISPDGTPNLFDHDGVVRFERTNHATSKE
jgi:hypothetical protein